MVVHEGLWTILMHDGNVGPDGMVDLPRAGFWRRLVATLIDLVVVAFPFQVLAVILFAVTAGMVQMHSGLTFNYCDRVKTIPQSLKPPPPHDSNAAQVCRISLFGATTAIVLTVGRVTKESYGTKIITQAYMLNKNGDPIDGISIDWFVLFAFFTYLIGMVWKTGRTVGARVVGVKVVDAAARRSLGVPIRKAVLRYLAMEIGFVPAFILLIYQRVTTDGSADAMFTPDFLGLMIYAVAALWIALLIYQAASKNDPVYDHLAGTVVVKDQSIEPVGSL
jgi:uncharacterized RDD family membrane protein YckC